MSSLFVTLYITSPQMTDVKTLVLLLYIIIEATFKVLNWIWRGGGIILELYTYKLKYVYACKHGNICACLFCHKLCWKIVSFQSFTINIPVNLSIYLLLLSLFCETTPLNICYNIVLEHIKHRPWELFISLPKQYNMNWNCASMDKYALMFAWCIMKLVRGEMQIYYWKWTSHMGITLIIFGKRRTRECQVTVFKEDEHSIWWVWMYSVWI